MAKRSLQKLVTDSRTQQIFLMWPNLVDVTARFCNFVSLVIPTVDNEPLFDYAVRIAVKSYNGEQDGPAKARAYVLSLIDTTAELLSGMTVEGLRSDTVVVWEPFVEPMTTWMERHHVQTIRTMRAGRQHNLAVARMSLLTHIATADEIEHMALLP